MSKLLQQLSIRQRIWILIFCSIIGILSIAIVAVNKAQTQYFQLKQSEYIKLTNVALKTITYYYQQFDSGKLTEAEAKQQAKAAIRSQALDDRNYAMIFHTSEMLLAHPFLDFAYKDETPELYQQSLAINRRGKADAGKRIGLDGPLKDVMSVIKVVHPTDYTGFSEYYLYYAEEDSVPVTQPIDVDPAKLPDDASLKMAYSTYFQPWEWVVISVVFRDDEKIAFYDWVTEMAIYSAILLTLIFVIALFISRSISQPLNAIAELMTDISHGTGDLTRRLDISGNNELSRLALGFNTFVEKIAHIVTSVADANDNIRGLSQRLSGSMQSIVDHSDEQLSETEMLASASNELSYSVKSVADRAIESSDAARSTEEATGQAQSSMSKNIRSIQQLSDALLNTQNQVASMESFSNKVSSVLEVIIGIAEQTNLLALNAAIEAARAGEQGRGFAVVADEVRTLAQRTQSSTSEIHEIIENLQSGTKNVVSAMKDGLNHSEICVKTATEASDVLQQAIEHVSKITQMNIEIASAVEEQSKVTQEMAQSSQTIASGSKETLEAAKENMQASKELNGDTQAMADLVKQFKVS
ncbi:methyl-accepting chemotaxis protein [Aurantivibrio plasticivorans]